MPMSSEDSRGQDLMKKANTEILKKAMDTAQPEEIRFEAYNTYIDQVTPKHSLFKNVIRNVYV